MERVRNAHTLVEGQRRNVAMRFGIIFRIFSLIVICVNETEFHSNALIFDGLIYKLIPVSAQYNRPPYVVSIFAVKIRSTVWLRSKCSVWKCFYAPMLCRCYSTQ